VELTLRQRNNIFTTLEANDIAPASCDLDFQEPTFDRGARTTIRHETSHSEFTVWHEPGRDGRYTATMTIGSVARGRLSSCTWDQLLDGLAEWAQEVRYEAETPDLWAELKQVPAVLASAQGEDASNAPFSSDEQAEISNRLDAVKQLVREQFELTDDELAAVDQKLDELKEASKRLGRKDWATIIIGGMVSIDRHDRCSAAERHPDGTEHRTARARALVRHRRAANNRPIALGLEPLTACALCSDRCGYGIGEIQAIASVLWS
jgi:hypothetical protein